MRRAERAVIHHRDNDPTNNPPDGSNWMVLCSTCHSKIHGKRGRHIYRDGVYIATLFAPWKREEILRLKGHVCEKCGVEVSSGVYPTKQRKRQGKYCYWCGRMIPQKREQIYWSDDRIMCKQCFDTWLEEIMESQQEEEPLPDI